MSYGVGLILGFGVLAVAQMPSGKARMVVCDVGQGDAILITKGNNQVLVDGGPSSEKILSCLEQNVPFYDRSIELIVLTNTDSDHLNGLNAVLDRYKVIQFVTADGVHGSDALTKLIGKLETNRISVVSVERGDLLKVTSQHGQNVLEFKVLWPPDVMTENVAIFGSQINSVKREQILGESAKGHNLNERSVVLLLLEDNKRILLMGDGGDQTERELVKMGDLAKIDVLKVGHHGSKYASTQEFLQMIRPMIAVISVGTKNTYGHPTPETLARLKQIGAEIRRTDMEGTIVLLL